MNLLYVTCDFMSDDYEDDPMPMCWCQYPLYALNMRVCSCECHKNKNPRGEKL